MTVGPLNPENPFLGEFVAAAERRYEHVRKLASACGAEFLLVWQPFLWVETAEVDPEVKKEEQGLTVMGARFLKARRNLTIINNALAARLQKKPYFVDFRNALCSRKTSVYEVDGVHLKPQGNKMVATHMAEMLKAKGWLKDVRIGPEKQ